MYFDSAYLQHTHIDWYHDIGGFLGLTISHQSNCTLPIPFAIPFQNSTAFTALPPSCLPLLDLSTPLAQAMCKFPLSSRHTPGGSEQLSALWLRSNSCIRFKFSVVHAGYFIIVFKKRPNLGKGSSLDGQSLSTSCVFCLHLSVPIVSERLRY